MISGVRKVIVPVADQQAALEFWTTSMGFELVRDDAYGDERWIEVRPPDQDLLLVLSQSRRIGWKQFHREVLHPAGTLQEGSQKTPTPQPPLRKLDFLVGSLHIEGETVPDFRDRQCAR